ncbi:MAG TPA: phosphatase PAP2 family protein [Ornithinibacter sp.]|nr:phosphatase PAP2 family protein [Ornithinibacter sp.]
MAFLTRWDEDQSRPAVPSALRDLAVRAVLPAIALFGVIVAFGYVLKGPLFELSEDEKEVNRDLQAARDGLWNAVTNLMSTIGNTEYVIGVCLVVVGLVWWRTKQWWYAVVPGIAISLQATVFVAATHVVGRARPTVERLDPTPPTSSFPSGHVGASTALYATFALMATRIDNPLVRRLVITWCVLAPAFVTAARLYRGAHHVTDVVFAILNGGVCAVLAWLYLRRRSATEATATGSVEAAGQTRA